MSNLVIVESPSKAATIKGYLGKGYKVTASKGHVRDLPKSTFGIDIENGFKPNYINIRGKGDLIKELKKEAKKADNIFLAADPDREGEAISWHLANVLGLDENKAKRVTFNEITKPAVKEAIKHPGKIDMNLVDAQQARRILDRIVGYKLSPVLWKKIKSGLSAGRVQSVATRIIVEREEEIRNFKQVEYWKIEAQLEKDGGKIFSAMFYGKDGKEIPVPDEKAAQEIVDAVKGGVFKVFGVKKSVKTNNPAPPFITSTLHQEANRKFGFRSEKTAKIAQELYEGIPLGKFGTCGLITYMRTDSLRISDIAAESAKNYIEEKYGKEYYPAKRRVYKSKNGAQDAHEAIRPSDIEFEPVKVKEYLSQDQYKLYKLIFDRFIASQMSSALLDTVSVDIENSGYIFRSSGYTVKHPGYMAVYEESKDENSDNEEQGKNGSEKIPELSKDEKLLCKKLEKSQHFTKPPARYTDASLIKMLEEKGIGRPSTYTPTITTIIQRGYVVREGKKLLPSKLGEVTTKLMKENFASIVDYGFTANMEMSLDDIEHGKKTVEEVLSSFYKDFSVLLSKAENEIDKENYKLTSEQTDVICEKCGSRMVIKNGRFGRFAACPNYPTCRNTKNIDKDGNVITEDTGDENKKYAPDDVKCDLCGGRMLIKRGRYGTFYACENYPSCKGTKQITKDINIACPLCSSKITVKYGRNKRVFYSCEKYPKCSFSTWDIPQEEKCPECGGLLLKKKGKDLIYCRNEKCSYSRNADK